MIYHFWITFAIQVFAIIIFDKKYCMLRDISKAAGHQPYSWARVQLAWWTVIVLSSFVAILWVKGVAPTLNSSTVILLGISAATTAAARVIDISDEEKSNWRHQDGFGKNFFLDILSDNNGVSVHRFQTVVFNGVFGIWFIHAVLNNLQHDCNTYIGDAKLLEQCKLDVLNYIMPPISDNNLILLGLSSATYAALKMTENNSNTATDKSGDASQNMSEEPSESIETADTDPAVG
jgi:hypothetical protein